MERKVMKQFGNGIHFQDFADLKKQIGSDPQNSRITKNEFLLAMIMRLGRLRETDQSLILGIYNDLDTDGSGDLDISDCAFFPLHCSLHARTLPFKFHSLLCLSSWETPLPFPSSPLALTQNHLSFVLPSFFVVLHRRDRERSDRCTAEARDSTGGRLGGG